MKRLTLMIVVLLLALSLACGGSKATPEKATPEGQGTAKTVEATAEKTVEKEAPSTNKTVEATEAPKETEEPKETPTEKAQPSGGDNAAFHIDSGAFEELDSYRSEMNISFTPADGDEGTIHIIQEATTDPAAQHLVMDMAGSFPGAEAMSGGEPFAIEVVVIEDQQWMNFGGMWMQTSSDSEDALNMDDMSGLQETFVNPDNLNSLSEEEGLKLIGDEEVNGINTKHYSAEYDALWGKLGIDSEDIESGSADIWVASQSGLPQFVVKMEFNVEGKLDIGDTGEKVDGTMVLKMEVTDINQPITIEAPEDAVGGGLPEDIPEYPNGKDLSALGGMVMFTTEDSVDDVTKFYEDEMEKAGWTAGEASFLGPSWTKDDRKVELMVTEDEEKKETSVIIMITEGEE